MSGNKNMKKNGLSQKVLWVVLPVLAFILSAPSLSQAHGFAGKRFFPTTFQVDDPFISDEFSILFNHIKTSDARTTAYDVEFSKRILPNFGFTIGETYQRLNPDGSDSLNGFGNLGLGLKYQFLTSAEHELILSIGTSVEVGGTGAKSLSPNAFSTISPAFFFGKGFGDLPESVKFLRPFAITGVIAPNIPSSANSDTVDPDTGNTVSVRNPTTFTWAFSLQYNLLYLQSFVKDVGLPSPFNRMVLVTEFPMETCLSGDCSGQTTGFVNPGVAWIGKYMELGLAAQIPINTNSGTHIGVLVLFHLFLDDLFPKSIGRPVFP